MGKILDKNLGKVQDMLDGNYKNKIQVGQYHEDIHANREIGERYFDHDDKEWEKTEYGRKSIAKLAPVGLGDQCSECEKLIIKKWDKDVYKWNKRCYYCQIDYEAQFSRKIGGENQKDSKYGDYLEGRYDDFKKDYIKRWEEENAEFVKELEKLENPFDTKLANALSNENIEMSINKNKNITK